MSQNRFKNNVLKWMSALAALLIIFSGCGSNPTIEPTATEVEQQTDSPAAETDTQIHGADDTSADVEPTATEVEQQTDSPAAETDTQGNPAQPATEADLQTCVAGNTAFAIDLYHKLRSEEGNLLFSPFSVSTALAMTYAGARGETAEQMAQTMHFSLPQAQLHAALKALDESLQSSGSEEEGAFLLNIANSLWGQRDYTFLPEFLDMLTENYRAGIQMTDFREAPEASRKEINDWVSDATHKRIQDLIPENDIDSNTRLVLVNAIYFDADWSYPFESSLTDEAAPFTLLNGEQITAPRMMWQESKNLPYLKGDNFEAVELPYAGDKIAMLLLVPNPGDFASFEGALSAAQVNDIVAQMEMQNLKVALPKFSYEDKSSLGKKLAEMGMPLAMSDGADFSGIDGTRNLSISKVLHKAFIKVDEKGTEAAAATAVIMRLGSAMDELLVTVDRPFIYLIRDLDSGSILFVGRVSNPQP